MIFVYTDGATSRNGEIDAVGGWAFIILNEKKEIIHQKSGSVKYATNNICEMMAIISACNYLDSYFPQENFIIYSDSAYIVNCYLQKWYRKWQFNGWLTSKNTKVLNQPLWEKLIIYFEKTTFDFKKVKGHANDEFNKLVDKLAVEAKGKC